MEELSTRTSTPANGNLHFAQKRPFEVLNRGFLSRILVFSLSLAQRAVAVRRYLGTRLERRKDSIGIRMIPRPTPVHSQPTLLQSLPPPDPLCFAATGYPTREQMGWRASKWAGALETADSKRLFSFLWNNGRVEGAARASAKFGREMSERDEGHARSPTTMAPRSTFGVLCALVDCLSLLPRPHKVSSRLPECRRNRWRSLQIRGAHDVPTARRSHGIFARVWPCKVRPSLRVRRGDRTTHGRTGDARGPVRCLS